MVRHSSSRMVSSHMLRLLSPNTISLTQHLRRSIHLLLSSGALIHHRSKATASIRRADAVGAVDITTEEGQSHR